MEPEIKNYYGSTIINGTDIAPIRNSQQFKHHDFKLRELSQEDRLREYACKPLDQSASFNQKAFKSIGNALLQLFFNEINIKYIQDRVKHEVLQLRGQTISTEIDNIKLQNLMQETLTLSYQGKMPQFISDSKICNLKNLISDLNKQVITKYVTHAISTIDMHKYYISDITTLPVPQERPMYTSIKGSNVVSQHVGLGSVEDFNRDIREWNNRFSRFSE